VGFGPITINPTSSISVVAMTVGDTTAYSGAGFLSGEQVSIAFPGYPATVRTADSTGSVAVTLTMPAEPYPSGFITTTSSAGTLTNKYTVIDKYTLPDTAEPYQSVPVTVSGYGASESVNFSFDSGPVSQTFTTDAHGSLAVGLLLSTTFKTHTVAATGATSGVTQSSSISLPAFMTSSPGSGPVGTTVTVDSGPGWGPNSTVHVYFTATFIKNVTADSVGKVHTTFQVPQKTPGSWTVKLTDDLLGISITQPFQITSSSSALDLKL